MEVECPSSWEQKHIFEGGLTILSVQERSYHNVDELLPRVENWSWEEAPVAEPGLEGQMTLL